MAAPPITPSPAPAPGMVDGGTMELHKRMSHLEGYIKGLMSGGVTPLSDNSSGAMANVPLYMGGTQPRADYAPASDDAVFNSDQNEDKLEGEIPGAMSGGWVDYINAHMQDSTGLREVPQYMGGTMNIPGYTDGIDPNFDISAIQTAAWGGDNVTGAGDVYTATGDPLVDAQTLQMLVENGAVEMTPEIAQIIAKGQRYLFDNPSKGTAGPDHFYEQQAEQARQFDETNRLNKAITNQAVASQQQQAVLDWRKAQIAAAQGRRDTQASILGNTNNTFASILGQLDPNQKISWTPNAGYEAMQAQQSGHNPSDAIDMPNIPGVNWNAQ